ncbi:MAG: hypothetical protein ACI9R3_006283, partial [Verrucomicrobiales bacterium]
GGSLQTLHVSFSFKDWWFLIRRFRVCRAFYRCRDIGQEAFHLPQTGKGPSDHLPKFAFLPSEQEQFTAVAVEAIVLHVPLRSDWIRSFWRSAPPSHESEADYRYRRTPECWEVRSF